MSPPSVRRRVIAVALAALVVVGAMWASEQWRRVIDLTADRTLTLTDETHDVVRAVKQTTRVVALVPRRERRAEAASLLERYERLNRNVRTSLVDPERSPGEVRRLGADPTVDAVVVSSGGRVEKGPTVTEQDITSAIARVVRGEKPLLCVTSGHGELDLEAAVDEGFAGGAEILRRNGYRTQPVDLLTSSELPDDCDAFVVARPASPLREEAQRALATRLAAGARALVLTDAKHDVDVTPIIEPYGLRTHRGIAVEGSPDDRFGNDAATPVVRSYRSAHPIARKLPPTFFPGAQAVLPGESRGGLTVEPIARTTEVSYLETDFQSAEPRPDRDVDLPGPIVVVAAADQSRVEDGRVVRTRLVVTGDADFATNAFVGQGGNSILLVRALDWLTLDEDLVSVSANLPQLRPLDLTPSRLAYARLLLAGLVPALFLLGGGVVWAMRRGR